MNDLPYQHEHPEVIRVPDGSDLWISYSTSHGEDAPVVVQQLTKDEAREYRESMRLTYLFLHGDDE